ncbi:unnamed protein product [Pleuronectes platessa]|uniref:Uncharacterized protein n=1 Tax=Pleuronectes platessa TaxID=8262 RepID=A0A9N7VJJ7_PLEPL|nr:unnamed protein product [Pleuronectes platessa]
MPGGDSAAWQTFSRPAGGSDWLPQGRLGSRNLAGSWDAPGRLRTPSPGSKYAERDTREEEKETVTLEAPGHLPFSPFGRSSSVCERRPHDWMTLAAFVAQQMLRHRETKPGPDHRGNADGEMHRVVFGILYACLSESSILDPIIGTGIVLLHMKVFKNPISAAAVE